MIGRANGRLAIALANSFGVRSAPAGVWTFWLSSRRQAFELFPRASEMEEDFAAQPLIAQAAIEALDVPIPPRA